MSAKEKKPATSFRLPTWTQDQIKEIADKSGMTHTQVIVLCVDRFWLQAIESKQEAPNISDEGSKKE